MLDDGAKAAGADDDTVKVGDIAIHLLDAIEAGERKFDQPDAPAAPSDLIQSESSARACPAPRTAIRQHVATGSGGGGEDVGRRVAGR